MATTAVSVRQEELEFLTVNGVRIAYADTVGTGAPVVLVHGSWGSHHNWDSGRSRAGRVFPGRLL